MEFPAYEFYPEPVDTGLILLLVLFLAAYILWTLFNDNE
jgi:hypothetical protein